MCVHACNVVPPSATWFVGVVCQQGTVYKGVRCSVRPCNLYCPRKGTAVEWQLLGGGSDRAACYA